MHTTLELFVCGLAGKDTVLYQRTTRDITGKGADPEQLLPQLFRDLGMDAGTGGVCAHSTSWRFADGAIILTYLALTPIASLTGHTAKLLCPRETSQAGAVGPLQPRPESITEDQVLVHGLGHLHYLAEQRREPFVTAALCHAGTLPIISRFAPTLAGRLHLS